MDIFDILTKKFNYRKLSFREKSLVSVCFFLFIQLIFLKFWINPKSNYYEELHFHNQSLEKENINNEDYVGYLNFADANINKFIKANNLSKDNIYKDINSDKEILKIDGNIPKDDFKKIINMPDFYGFNKIELRRISEDNFTYSFESFKPAERIQYKDLKNAYFSYSSESNTKENSENNLIKETEEAVKSLDFKEVNLKNNNNNLTKTKNNSKTKQNTKNADTIISNNSNIDASQTKSNVSMLAQTKLSANTTAKIKTETDIEKIINEDVQTSNKLDNFERKCIFDLLNNSNIIEFQKANIISCNFTELLANRFIFLELIDNKDLLNIELFVPYNYNGNFGVVNELGEYKRLDSEIEIGKWNNVELKLNNMSKFYYLPNEDGEIIFYLRDVYE